MYSVHCTVWRTLAQPLHCISSSRMKLFANAKKSARCHESNPGFSVRVHFIISWRHFCAVEWNNRRPIDSPLPPKLALDNLNPSISDQQKTESEILWPTKNNPSPFIYDPKAHPVTKKNTSSGILESYLQHLLTKNPQTDVLHISTFGLFIPSNTKDVVVNVSIWLKFSNLQNLWSLSARILWYQ